jgi:hypothetical protein
MASVKLYYGILLPKMMHLGMRLGGTTGYSFEASGYNKIIFLPNLWTNNAQWEYILFQLTCFAIYSCQMQWPVGHLTVFFFICCNMKMNSPSHKMATACHASMYCPWAAPVRVRHRNCQRYWHDHLMETCWGALVCFLKSDSNLHSLLTILLLLQCTVPCTVEPLY